MADAAASLGASMGKGAWDCDARAAIPPEKEVWLRRGGGETRRGERHRSVFCSPLPPPPQAEVFEEIPTMEHAFHGIPTVPPRKDMSHMVCVSVERG